MLPFTGPSAPTDLAPLVLDVAINLDTKKALQSGLLCAGTSHTSTDPVGALQSLLGQHRDALFANGQPNLQCDRQSKSKEDSGFRY